MTTPSIQYNVTKEVTQILKYNELLGVTVLVDASKEFLVFDFSLKRGQVTKLWKIEGCCLHRKVLLTVLSMQAVT